MENYAGPSTFQYPGGYVPYQYYAQSATPYVNAQFLQNGDTPQPQNGVPFPAGAYPVTAAQYVTPLQATDVQLPLMQPPRLGRPQYILEQDTKKTLKSAMKKPKMASAPAVPLVRRRTGSGARQRTQTLSRQRTNSNAAQYVPDHIFVSFQGTNKLRVDNVVRRDMCDRFDDYFISMSDLAGTTSDHGRTSYELLFPHRLWDARGDDARRTYKVICRLFMILAEEGFHYVTTIDAGHTMKPPRLVFANMHIASPLDFFCAALANDGYNVMIYHAPQQLAIRLSLAMRATFKNKLDASVDDSNVCSIRIKPLDDPTDKHFIISYLFKYLCDEGYYIDASVPLGRKGLFGLGGRREVWMFKSSPPATVA
ncbi:hypothetical protein PUNSTDRAFT_140231 [Punctularia strigosozonata HHB-11173 SS5]|uniref:uncharacterized protein n=1 Tax=Punctularia strigosozonata (strain HHB-11173) TaxID=741275 RepID=UPI0004418299|nr:uncharacterized protein PUNSTDRAFT_140231 [Punctularia strigosozonata HHB-11173 SS5]EIN13767.1 hypothetical protein PUNSTDRAFT_140231 [Punctularia strigosozonata HHB-11173 SS5]